MRFRTKQRPRGLLRPSDQVRLTLLVVGFGIVLLGFRVAKTPEVWNTLFGEPRQTASAATTANGAQAADIDAENSGNSLRADEFFATTSDSAPPPDNSPAEARDDSQPAADGTHSTQKPAIHQDTVVPTLAAGVLTMPDELLRTIRDDVIGVNADEAVAYYAALKMAALIKPEAAEKLPGGSFALFMDAPNASRGKAFTIDGQLRRLTAMNRAVNEFGVGTLYDAWVTTADSGDRLLHVVAMTADESLKPAESYGKNPPDVRFTGYFFKREGYATRDSVSVAPLFLTATLQRIPEPVALATRSDQLTPYLGWLAVAVCAGIAFVMWSFLVSDSRNQQSRIRQLTRLPSSASFDGVSSVSVNETLHQLEADATRAESPFPELRSDV